MIGPRLPDWKKSNAGRGVNRDKSGCWIHGLRLSDLSAGSIRLVIRPVSKTWLWRLWLRAGRNKTQLGLLAGKRFQTQRRKNRRRSRRASFAQFFHVSRPLKNKPCRRFLSFQIAVGALDNIALNRNRAGKKTSGKNQEDRPITARGCHQLPHVTSMPEITGAYKLQFKLSPEETA